MFGKIAQISRWDRFAWALLGSLLASKVSKTTLGKLLSMEVNQL